MEVCIYTGFLFLRYINQQVKKASKVTGYEPGTHFYLKLYFHLTICQSLKNPHALKNSTPSSNLTMYKPAPAFNNIEWGNIPPLTYLPYKTWKETMTLVLQAMDTYNIINSKEPEKPLIDIDYDEWIM